MLNRPEAHPEAPTDWHARTADAVLAALATDGDGLTREEAERRLAETGPNRLTPPRRHGGLVRFLRQFHNILIYVLLGAGAITALLGHWLDSGVIFAVVVVNAVIGFIQEGRAEHALEAIRNLLSPQAMVLRDGRRLSVAAETLVPGDVVLVRSGDKLPADIRLLRARHLQIQEAVLTGESLPVEKSAAPVAAGAVLGDRASMAYSGTLVGSGQGTGVVVATGDATEIGRIGALLARIEGLTTPLLRQMARFGRWLTAAIMVLAAATFALGLLAHGFAATEMFLAAVAVAVAAIPEGLPAVMTITLAIGVERMALRNAIIRRLPAVETLGSVTVICADKTGTFTRNEMMVESVATGRHLFAVTGSGYAPEGEFLRDGAPVASEDQARLRSLATAGLLCSDADLEDAGAGWRIQGDPMEAALVVLAAKAGLDPAFERKARPRTDEIPFESEHRFMATLSHDHEGRGTIYVKGAPERVLAMCARQGDLDGDAPLDAPYWRRRMDEMVARGERVLAVARKDAEGGRNALMFSDVEKGLVLLGLFGFADPPRDEAIDAVALCRQAGIRVKMITGDHVGTAKAIAARLGLANPDAALTGADLDGRDGDDFALQAAEIDVFARTSPEHKLRLVEALQARGEVVAMTGDGVNDAPALKRADIGVAMGLKGAETAKEAAAMVLADDNFASIARAVEEGRTVYDNLGKAILFILPTSAGEAFTVVAAIVFGMLLPITAVQILWVNMITAVTLAVALGFEPGEAGVMRRPPRRRDEPILSAFVLWRVVFVTAVIVIGVFGIFRWLSLAGAEIETARTAAVNTLVMFEAFYLFNVRRLEALPFAGFFGKGARAPWIAVAVVVLFQLVFTYAPPMQPLFRTRPLALADWGLILAVSGSIFVLVEMEKLLRRIPQRYRRTSPKP